MFILFQRSIRESPTKHVTPPVREIPLRPAPRERTASTVLAERTSSSTCSVPQSSARIASSETASGHSNSISCLLLDCARRRQTSASTTASDTAGGAKSVSSMVVGQTSESRKGCLSQSTSRRVPRQYQRKQTASGCTRVNIGSPLGDAPVVIAKVEDKDPRESVLLRRNSSSPRKSRRSGRARYVVFLGLAIILFGPANST